MSSRVQQSFDPLADAASLGETAQLKFAEDLNGVWLQQVPDVFLMPIQSLAALKQQHGFILWDGTRLTINAANGRAEYSLEANEDLLLKGMLMEWSASGRLKA